MRTVRRIKEHVARGVSIDVAMTAKDNSLLRVAQTHGGRDEAFEHSLEIERRTTDRLEHVGGRCLLLQRRLEIARARLHLVKQAHVLDRDHRLVGEGLKERDLRVRERPDFRPPQHDRADRLALAHQRRRESGPPGQTRSRRADRVFRERNGDGIFVLSGREVVHVDGLAVGDGAPGRPIAADRPLDEIRGKGNRPIVGGNAQVPALPQQDERVIGSAELAGRLREPVEHRPQVAGR